MLPELRRHHTKFRQTISPGIAIGTKPALTAAEKSAIDPCAHDMANSEYFIIPAPEQDSVLQCSRVNLLTTQFDGL